MSRRNKNYCRKKLPPGSLTRATPEATETLAKEPPSPASLAAAARPPNAGVGSGAHPDGNLFAWSSDVQRVARARLLSRGEGGSSTSSFGAAGGRRLRREDAVQRLAGDLVATARAVPGPIWAHRAASSAVRSPPRPMCCGLGPSLCATGVALLRPG